MAEEAVVLSPEQLWALNDEEAIEQYRGPDVEITDFEHKIANDMKSFAREVNIQRDDNEVRYYATNQPGQLQNEDMEFDHVKVTSPE